MTDRKCASSGSRLSCRPYGLFASPNISRDSTCSSQRREFLRIYIPRSLRLTVTADCGSVRVQDCYDGVMLPNNCLLALDHAPQVPARYLTWQLQLCLYGIFKPLSRASFRHKGVYMHCSSMTYLYEVFWLILMQFGSSTDGQLPEKWCGHCWHRVGLHNVSGATAFDPYGTFYRLSFRCTCRTTSPSVRFSFDIT